MATSPVNSGALVCCSLQGRAEGRQNSNNKTPGAMTRRAGTWFQPPPKSFQFPNAERNTEVCLIKLNKVAAIKKRTKHVLDFLLLHDQRNYVRKRPKQITIPTKGFYKTKNGTFTGVPAISNELQHITLTLNSSDFRHLLY